MRLWIVVGLFSGLAWANTDLNAGEQCSFYLQLADNSEPPLGDDKKPQCVKECNENWAKSKRNCSIYKPGSDDDILCRKNANFLREQCIDICPPK
jgi:hypothetical protein